MRICALGDADTVLGFRMAGIEGHIADDPETAEKALRRVEKEKEVILIVPERVADWVRDDIDRIRYNEELPLIVEIPGPEGPSEEGPSLFRLIREAVGISFGD
ncbi:MAG: V-type ATP synthase subunit F [Candidatus Brocadiia bacterium]